MSSLAKPRYTVEQYLALERQADHKSEFLGGEIFAMAGTGFRHNVIVANLMRALGDALRAGPCQPVANDQRVRVQATGLNTYPDVAVVCGPPDFTDDYLDTLLNPCVIVEVLSDSTEAYDRGEKFAHYRRIESLSDYVLVSQSRMLVEHFVRQGERWVLSAYDTAEAVVQFSSIGCGLPLSEAYERVSFAGSADPEAV